MSANTGYPNPHGKVVLVIEDSPTQAMMARELLQSNGLKVILAVNGEMGVNLAHTVSPVLILLDVQMPDINGFEVCERLKNDPETANIPVIMFTRNDSPQAVQQGLETGALDYIPKDAFANAVLLETLHQMGLIDPKSSPDEE